MSNPSLETVRTAAYLAARERLDFRGGKTRRTVQCTPPNVQCGGRCIPPDWDCRLKGQGADPHLAARRTDPISGFANLERGFKRIGKFASTGSFSELESGKRSIVRGAVKLKPGNLKEKNEFKDWLENNYLKIAVPLFLAGGAVSAHSILKAGNTFGYRDGVGRKVDNAVGTGIGKVLDVIPGLGQARGYTRQQASEAMRSNLQRVQLRTERSRGMTRTPESYVASTAISPTLIKGGSDLTKALRNVNEQKAANSFYQWNQKHRQAFWGATHSTKNLSLDEQTLAGKSIFAEPTAQAYINNEWRLNLPAKATRPEYINALTNRIASERDAYVQLAKQQGFRVQGRPGEQAVNRDDIDAFVARNIKDIGDENQRRAQSAFIGALVRGGAASSKARSIYEGHIEAYDSYYKKVARSVERVAGASDTDPDMVAEGLVAIKNAAERRRIDYMLSTSNKPRKSSAGPAHDRLFLQDYYHTRVVGSPSSKYTITADEAVRAASELSGNQVKTSQEAIALLNTAYGFKGAQLEQRRDPFRRRTTPTTQGAETARPARRRVRSRAQIVADLKRAGYSSESAETEADRIIAQRRTDEESDSRLLAYLETQQRLDKRCGKSGIAENKKCSKPTPAQSREAAQRAKGAAEPGITCAPGTQQCGKICIPQSATCHIKAGGGDLKSNLAKGALAAGAVAGVALAGRAAYKNRRSITAYTGGARYMDQAIKRMSEKDVRQGLSKLPKQWQQPASKLLGKAKVGLARISADMQGMEVRSIDNDNNFSTLVNPKTGHVLSIGSVDDTLVTFVSERKGAAGQFPKYGVAFQTDLSFSQKSDVSKAQSLAVSKQVKTMFDDQLAQLPENAVLFNKPFKDDGLGKKRASIYKRFKFRELNGLRGGEMYALKNQGKLTAIPEAQEDYIAALIRGGDTQSAAERFRRSRGDALDAVRSATYLLMSEKLAA